MKHKTVMTPLEIRHLKNFCYRWQIDPLLIDPMLNYEENKTELMSQVHTFDLENRLDDYRAQQEEEAQYVRDNFLMFYRAYEIYGDTASVLVGKPDDSKPEFSLKAMTNVEFSLQSMLQRNQKAKG